MHVLSTGQLADVHVDLDSHRRRNEGVADALELARAKCGVRLLDPTVYLCARGRCDGSRNGRPLYYDAHHLSEYGNRFLVPMFKPVFDGK